MEDAQVKNDILTNITNKQTSQMNINKPAKRQ